MENYRGFYANFDCEITKNLKTFSCQISIDEFQGEKALMNLLMNTTKSGTPLDSGVNRGGGGADRPGRHDFGRPQGRHFQSVRGASLGCQAF